MSRAVDTAHNDLNIKTCIFIQVTHRRRNRKEAKHGCLKVESVQLRVAMNVVQHKTVNLLETWDFFLSKLELWRWLCLVSISKSWTLYWKLYQLVHLSSNHPTKLIHQLIDRLTVRLEGARRKSQLIQPKMPTHRTMFETFIIWRKKTQNVSVSWVGSGIRKTRVWNLHVSGHLWILSKVLSLLNLGDITKKATILLCGIVHGVDEPGHTVFRTKHQQQKWEILHQIFSCIYQSF